MSEVDSALIHRGFWVNNDQGRVLGATLTIDQGSANAIVALLAILVSVAATSAWNLILFVVHQSRATAAPKDGLFRQQQILLRTLATPGTIFMEGMKLGKVWWFESTHAAVRCVIPALIALAFVALSTTAGVFSSYIVATENARVLVQGTACRNLNITTYMSTSTQDFDVNMIDDATALSNECYGFGSAPSRCNFYVKPRIDFSTETGNCPFNSSMCVQPENALVMDTGVLDANTVLGFNFPSHDRISFRRRNVCAPLQATEYIKEANASYPPIEVALGRQALPNEKVWLFCYGLCDRAFAAHEFDRFGAGNVTSYHSVTAARVSPFYSTIAANAYSNQNSLDYSFFTPIDPVYRNDSDVVLNFISSNQVLSASPINDPIYAAHQPHRTQNAGGNFTVYSADQPAGVLGCSVQYQFCINTASDSPECTPLEGSTANDFAAMLPSASPRQISFLQLLGGATTLVSQIWISGGINPSYLNATSKINAGWVSGLPDDQWKFDAQKMEILSLAYLQTFSTMHAVGFKTGPPDDSALVSFPSTQSDQQICQEQRVIKPGGFANINVFGLAMIVSVSGLLMILDFGVLRMLVFFGDFKTRVSPKLLFWFEDGIFWVQRHAYETSSNTLWGKTDNEIPVTGRGEKLRNLGSYWTTERGFVGTTTNIIQARETNLQTDIKIHDGQNDEKSHFDARIASYDSVMTRESESPSEGDMVVPIPAPWPRCHNGGA